MRNNSLSKNGLSMSQAQSVSNLCAQEAKEITELFNGINNASRTVTLGSETHVLNVGKPIPSNLVELLIKKANLHACQAFLVENIKAKEDLIAFLRAELPVFLEEKPTRAPLKGYEELPLVTEEYGWEQLTKGELITYFEAQAYAAHIGSFIHAKGMLTMLREELPTIPTTEWGTFIDGQKTPIKVAVHHSSEQLFNIHSELAALHSNYEQKVNFFKAKVKNLTAAENDRILKVNKHELNLAQEENRKIIADYNMQLTDWSSRNNIFMAEFEETRLNRIRAASQLRIEIPEVFKPIVDKFMAQVKKNDLETEASA